MSVAEFVASNRCPSCGTSQQRMVWTPQKIVDALLAFNAEHGRPPCAQEWRAGTADHPAAQTLHHMFGSWNNGIRAAGLDPRISRFRSRWTRDAIADAMLDWLFDHGRWPRKGEWHRSGDNHPCESHVVYRFGSWNAAKRYAGWNPDAPAPWRCAGCERPDKEGVTLGCAHCTDRQKTRESRARKSALVGDTAPLPGRVSSLTAGEGSTSPKRKKAA